LSTRIQDNHPFDNSFGALCDREQLSREILLHVGNRRRASQTLGIAVKIFLLLPLSFRFYHLRAPTSLQFTIGG
jgi:hypothetical protein